MTNLRLVNGGKDDSAELLKEDIHLAVDAAIMLAVEAGLPPSEAITAAVAAAIMPLYNLLEEEDAHEFGRRVEAALEFAAQIIGDVTLPVTGATFDHL